jgi:polar amino acid transport system substrate-binding protein
MRGMRAAAAAALTLLAAVPTRAAADALVNPYEDNEAARAEGRSLFNQYCSHCHAPNAMNPDPPKDLRRLRIRYGDAMRETFYTTVTHGRPDKGMPNWSGVLDDPTFWKIYSFLESVQSQP